MMDNPMNNGNMADAAVFVSNPEEVDVPQGQEPGASRHSILISDSYEDLSYDLDELLQIDDGKKLRSGTISRIRKGEDSPIPAVASSNHLIEESSQTSSNRTTPSIDLNHDQEIGDQDISTQDGSQNESAISSASNDTTPHPQVQEVGDDEVDYVHKPEWKLHKKHVFILSEAGKPIYCRHGNEDKLVTIFGVMQALVSFVQDGKDNIRSIVAGGHKFVFLVREHLILVTVANTYESKHQLTLQLQYVYNQILSVLTLSQLARIFKQRRNYDLRRWLTGAEKFIDNLLDLMDCDPSFLLGGVRCLPLDSHTRDTVAHSIAQHAKVKDLVFAILVANNQLVTMVRMKKYFLHPLDLHLIFNLVSASESFKAAESWTPICLPKFDSGGFLHAHISYLDEECECCLLLLTVDRDVFFTLSECKQKIQQRLVKYNCLKTIADSLRKGQYRISEVGIPDLRHFLYKSRSTAQFTSPKFDAPYNSEAEQDRVFGLYQYLHQRIHCPSRPLKILFHVGPYETLLGWVTAGFELYAVFGPLVTKPVAINSVNKLLKWIKKEEDRLFILNSPTF